MAWVTPRTWVTNEIVTAAQLNEQIRDNMNETAPAVTFSASPGHIVGNEAVNDLVYRLVVNNAVATAQTTTSTTYTDLTTVGPARSVSTGTSALVCWSARVRNATVGGISYVGLTISGATSSAAADALALQFEAATSNQIMRAGVAQIYLGLTGGSNTFTMQYRVSAGTGEFAQRNLSVIPF